MNRTTVNRTTVNTPLKTMLAALALLLVALPAPGAAQNDPRSAFVGVWRTTYNDPSAGPTAVEMVFLPTGFYSQETRTAGGSYSYIPGRWRIVGNGVLRLDVDAQNAQPQQYCGPLGCTPIRYPAGETHYFRFTNGGASLILQYAACASGGCQFVSAWTYSRVR